MSYKYRRYIQGCTSVRAGPGKCRNLWVGFRAREVECFSPVVVRYILGTIGVIQRYATGEFDGKWVMMLLWMDSR